MGKGVKAVKVVTGSGTLESPDPLRRPAVGSSGTQPATGGAEQVLGAIVTLKRFRDRVLTALYATMTEPS
jgi:hypothetical protein